MMKNLNLFLNVVSSKTSNGHPLHRAKALKWTSECTATSQGLNQRDKEELWRFVLDRALVERDDRGNILCLSNEGEEMVSKIGNAS